MTSFAPYKEEERPVGDIIKQLKNYKMIIREDKKLM